MEESDAVEACRLLEQALALLPLQNPACTATADKIRNKLASIAGSHGAAASSMASLLLNSGGSHHFLVSPEQLPLTPCSMLLHNEGPCDDLQVLSASAISFQMHAQTPNLSVSKRPAAILQDCGVPK